MLDINNLVTKNIGVGLVQELVQVVKSGGTVGSVCAVQVQSSIAINVLTISRKSECSIQLAGLIHDIAISQGTQML